MNTILTRTYRVKLRLSKSAHARLDDELQAQCRLYNAALEHRRWAWKMGRHSVTYAEQSRELTLVRSDDPAYSNVHRTIQIGTLHRLDRAFGAFFRRVQAGEKPGFPRFKSSRRFRTIVCDNNVQARSMLKVDEDGRGYLRIKGLPIMRFRARRELPAVENLAEIRVTRTPRRVEAHLVFRTPSEVPDPPKTPENPVGLAMGVHQQVTMSDGRMVPGYQRDTRRLKRLQRKVSRAQRGSNSRRKKATALAREADRLAARRKGWTHELSADIVRSGYDLVAAQALDIQEMMERWSEDLPRSIEARVNRGIADQAWGDLISKTAYKAESAGVRFVQVDPEYTTRDCSRCGGRMPDAVRSEVYRCAQCGLTMNRRVNSALNVLRRGLLAHAAGGNSAGASVGRLPTASSGTGRRRIPHTDGRGPPTSTA